MNASASQNKAAVPGAAILAVLPHKSALQHKNRKSSSATTAGTAMALVTGDECGLLKLADLHRNTATRIDEHEVQARSRGILKIATSAVDDLPHSYREGPLDVLCTRQSAAHFSKFEAGGRRRDLGPGAGSKQLRCVLRLRRR